MPKQLSQIDRLPLANVLAVARVFDPLIDFMLATGLTVHDLSRILRERAVRRVNMQTTKNIGRQTKSRVAIQTGLPRSEISRILAIPERVAIGDIGHHPVRRVLSAWYDQPDFRTKSGQPAVLTVFGGKQSFERLVKSNSGGIPVRAMLDELIALEVVEVMPDQRVKAKSRVPDLWNFDSTAMKTIGDRMRDLFDTLLNNLRASSPLFEGTAMVDEIHAPALQNVSREISQQSASFIANVNLILSRARNKNKKSIAQSCPAYRVGVTAYQFQAHEVGELESVSRPNTSARGRKNFRRHPRKITGEKGNARNPRSKKLK